MPQITEARREYMRRYQREYLARRRAAFLAGKCCVQCGSTERLEVDHIDPSQKVSHNVWSWSQERRDVELAKCQVLCHDCHREKTIEQTYGGRAPCGTASKYKKGCRCDGCRAGHAEEMRLYRNGGIAANRAATARRAVA